MSNEIERETNSNIVLPKEKIKPSVVNPALLLIYGPPKVGKTSIISQLNNCLIIDLEKGSRYTNAMKIEANSIDDLRQIGKAILEEKKPYEYIAIDTITKLEEWCEIEAVNVYKKTLMGRNFKGNNILELPNGAGYFWLRETFKKAINSIKKLADNVILIGHVKDKYIEQDGKEVNTIDIDLTGKLRNIVSSDVDAIGYLYREKENNYISFKTSQAVICGNRPIHLQNKIIEISSLNKDGSITTNWDQIYIK